MNCGEKAPQSGVKFSIYVGDDDSTTLADIKIPYGVEKWSELLNSQFKGYKLHH